MRAVATAVLVLALAPFLHACAYEPLGCDREEVPEFFATDEQITRNDVVAVLGEPIETFEREDRRVDVYEYDINEAIQTEPPVDPLEIPPMFDRRTSRITVEST